MKGPEEDGPPLTLDELELELELEDDDEADRALFAGRAAAPLPFVFSAGGLVDSCSGSSSESASDESESDELSSEESELESLELESSEEDREGRGGRLIAAEPFGFGAGVGAVAGSGVDTATAGAGSDVPSTALTLRDWRASKTSCQLLAVL